MTFEKIDKLAGGRVYTGRQAKSLGLVDELGTLNDAITDAKILGKIEGEGKPELLILPEPQGVFESLLGPLEDLEGMQGAALAIAPEEIRAALGRINLLNRLLRREPVLLMMPYDLKIR